MICWSISIIFHLWFVQFHLRRSNQIKDVQREPFLIQHEYPFKQSVQFKQTAKFLRSTTITAFETVRNESNCRLVGSHGLVVMGGDSCS